jgi:HSP20 family protein
MHRARIDLLHTWVLQAMGPSNGMRSTHLTFTSEVRSLQSRFVDAAKTLRRNVMAIVRRAEEAPALRREWDPFQSMRELLSWDPFQHMLPRLWPTGAAQRFAFTPAFDVRETKDAFVIKADLPGFREQDIDVNVTANRLTVSGKREAERVEKADTYYCSERSHGSFTRSFTLPDGVETEQIQAELKDGILALQVPKSAEAQPKHIPIRGGESADVIEPKPEEQITG